MASAKLPIFDSPVSRRADQVSDHLGSARSHDLVFAVVGHVGSGLGSVASKLAAELRTAAFGFLPIAVDVSHLLEQRGSYNRPHQRSIADIRHLQKIGDNLRKNHGDSIAAGLAIKHIYEHRRRATTEQPKAFVIDSLKHPAEVDVLRRVYGSSFYLISVVCNENTRAKRLQRKFHEPEDTEEAIRQLMQDDEAGIEDHGQQVRKTLHLGDLFIANEDDCDSDVADELHRFLEAITGTRLVRPTTAERGMHAAWSAGLRSACLSRQVGAAIVSKNGQVLATGTNDPPAFGGGLYHEGSSPDYRCFRWNGETVGRGCRNDWTKQTIYESVHKQLVDDKLISDRVPVADIIKALAKTRVRDLIEFSRAIHAEMDAILSMLRNPGESPVGSTLYCTTYPCHSCARHIVAAGIHEVVYIEPYTKSMAVELHPDTIEEVFVPQLPGTRVAQRVVFRLFSGIAPRRFASLFESRGDWKDKSGTVLSKRGGEHVDPILKGSFLELEANVAEMIQKKLENST